MEPGGSIGLEIGKLIIGNGDVIEGAFVGIENGIISEVSEDGFEARYENVFDFGDRIVMPGLIDAHVDIKYTVLENKVKEES